MNIRIRSIHPDAISVMSARMGLYGLLSKEPESDDDIFRGGNTQ